MSISVPLISRYLAGDASDSDSGDESGGDEDDDESEETPKGQSENQDNDKLDDSKYRKKVYEIKAKWMKSRQSGALPNFRGNKSNADPSSVRECQNRNRQRNHRQRSPGPGMYRNFDVRNQGCGKICSSSEGLKNHTRTQHRDRQSSTAIH